eukprot:scaffold12966_cov38-Attheya_sp.AAC.3
MESLVWYPCSRSWKIFGFGNGRGRLRGWAGSTGKGGFCASALWGTDCSHSQLRKRARGTIEGLEASIKKGVQRSRDNVVTVGGKSFAGAPKADVLVSTWKPEAWGCLVSFHILLSLTSTPNEDFTGVMLTEKAWAAAGFETVLGSKVYVAL